MRKLCEEIGFYPEATEIFEKCADIIMNDEESRKGIYEAMDSFFCSDPGDFDKKLESVSEKSGINIYTVNMIFVLLCARPLKYIFAKQNISEEIYYDTMQDLKYKLDECKKLYGVWGTFVPWWYKAVFNRPVVKLGRLEYEKSKLLADYADAAKKGDAAFSCHIPSCGPLKITDMIESLKMAYEFFGCTGDMLLQCNSWMLYPPHYELFPENSNLRMFYDLFDVISWKENENLDMWRIFYKETTEDFKSLPQDTKLRKAFAEYLSSGNKMGTGYGILVFDGENIIKKQRR